MAGIYIHIPFCKQKCSYCDFHFSTSFEAYRSQMIEALLLEIEQRSPYINKNESINSIYFGGGTPSLLTSEELNAILTKIDDHFDVNLNCERTLEANPDDIHLESLAAWKKSGINRLSIGLQSFKKADLDWMNRAHSVEESYSCVSLAQSMGFDNLTVDLMYGLPHLTNDEWEHHIQQVIKMGVTHISAYCLTIEEKTELNALVNAGKISPASEDTQSEQFTILVETLEKNGFIHYEISNFCKPNHQAIHNSNYWKGENYLGIGPSAHSFNQVSRAWNVRNNREYIRKVNSNEGYFETEILTLEDRFNELLLTGLRTNFGVSIQKLTQCLEIPSTFWEAIQFFTQQQLLFTENETLFLTKKGKLQADKIASDLFQIKP